MKNAESIEVRDKPDRYVEPPRPETYASARASARA